VYYFQYQNGSEYGSATKRCKHKTNNMAKSETDGFLAIVLILKDVFIAGVFATGLWVIGEKFENLGYEMAANICNFSACVIFISVLPFEIAKHNPRYWRVVAAVFFVVVVAPTGFVFFFLKPAPKPMPAPHFIFILRDLSAPDNTLFLTNDCFAITRFAESDPEPFTSYAVLCMPGTMGSNIVLQILVKNDTSEADAEYPEISFTADQSLNCSPSREWKNERSHSFNFIEIAPGIFKTNITERWEYSLPEDSLFRGEGKDLPLIAISPSAEEASVAIEARAKDSPAALVGFTMKFFSPPHKGFGFVVLKPFFMTVKPWGHGRGGLFFSPEKIEELKEQGFISLN
jgi:hypothetical protein